MAEEELSANALVDAKNEYTKLLTSYLTPCITEGFISLYDDAKTEKEEKMKEESIKLDIELIESWRVIEERILVEKTKLLKKLQDEFRHDLKLRYLELDKKYGGFDIKNKYRR